MITPYEDFDVIIDIYLFLCELDKEVFPTVLDKNGTELNHNEYNFGNPRGSDEYGVADCVSDQQIYLQAL